MMSVTWDEAKSGVEQAVDALAAQVIGWPEGSPSQEWMHSIQSLLNAISREAEAIQRPEVARAAGELARRSGQDKDTLLPALEQAIEDMRADLRTAAPVPPPIAEDPELLNDFVLEAREHLAAIEENLLVLEREPHHADAIHTVFRSFHTIKGLAGFLDLAEMQEVSHEVETILDLARNDQLAITPKVIDVVLAAADHLKHWLAFVEGKLNGQPVEGPATAHALLGRVRALAIAPALDTAPAAPECEAGEPAAPVEKPLRAKSGVKSEAHAVRVETAKLDYLVDMVGEMMIAQSLVRHDPDLAGLNRPRLARNLSQLARITQELQKTAMSTGPAPGGGTRRSLDAHDPQLARPRD
ncbi:MAG: Hpt domain-containing protein [Acidobacteria bacterium]|nr:Hpt domain-containing protein [Acidobacteriota bacterium]